MGLGCGPARVVGLWHMVAGAFFVVFVGVHLCDDLHIKTLEQGVPPVVVAVCDGAVGSVYVFSICAGVQVAANWPRYYEMV